MATYLIIIIGIAGLIGGLALTGVGVAALMHHRRRRVAAPTPAVPKITLEGKGEFAVEPGVLLNTLWEHLPDAACQAGECGGCKLRLLSGEVAWIRDPATEVDRSTHILACSCEARGSLRCAPV
jgi:ferredoxin